MKQAYSVQQVASLFGLSTEVTRALVGAVLGEERDVLSREDLSLVREAHDLRQRKTLSPVAPREGTEKTGQRFFDFGTPAGAPQPHDAEASFSRAVALEAQDPGDALDAYAEALAANPRHADAHVNRGRLLHQLGHLREAEAHYAAALVARPTDTTATFNLAVVLEDLGRVDDAIARYHQAIELDGTCVDAYFNLARLYERKGEKMAAIRHLKDYRRLVGQRS